MKKKYITAQEGTTKSVRRIANAFRKVGEEMSKTKAPIFKTLEKKERKKIRDEQKMLEHMIKRCGTPEDFVFDYINGASQDSDVRRMREYVSCVNRAEWEYKQKHPHEKKERVKDTRNKKWRESVEKAKMNIAIIELEKEFDLFWGVAPEGTKKHKRREEIKKFLRSVLLNKVSL